MKNPKVRGSKSPKRTAQLDRRRIKALCKWFDGNARDLPWRSRRNGYTALVAEAMLQQTQVARVVEYFRLFVRRFPTARSLAAASEQEVLAMWQGLGYYRRARNLHAAARMIVAEFGGRVPKSVEQLRRLPGVGRYTAGAIASIVFGEREPIVDGNVQRVLARWFGNREPIGTAALVDWTWIVVAELVGVAGDPGPFNEAMMELGATVCTPKSPRCEQCPVSAFCVAKRDGSQGEIPVVGARAKPRAAHHYAVVVTRNGSSKVLLEQRSEKGMWAKMWQAPTVESDQVINPNALRDQLTIRVSELKRCGSFEHHTTHRHIQFHLFTAQTNSRRGVWRAIDDLADLPMGNAQRRVLREVLGIAGAC